METNKNNEIGMRLYQIRKQHFKETQEHFAHRCEISKSDVGKIEAGYQTPSFNVLTKICIKCDVSADWLIFGLGQKFRLPADHFLNQLASEKIEILSLIEQGLSGTQQIHFWRSVREILSAILGDPEA